MRPVEIHLNETARNRFWAKVKKNSSCWEWTAGKTKFGYGTFNNGSGSRLAHRVSWVIENGPVPDGKLVCHTCDNPSCVNPKHLFVGTQSDNVCDMWAKGRGGAGALPGIENHRSKICDKDVVAIRARLDSGEYQRVIAKDYGLTQSNVSHIATGKTWSHI